MSYRDLSHTFKFDETKMEQVKNLFRTYTDKKFMNAFQEMKPWTFFTVEGGGLPEGSTYWISIVRTKEKIYAYHSEAMVTYDGEILNRTLEPTEDDWKKLFIDITPDRIEYSHYDYLDALLNPFWKLVFDKTADDMWCGGIVSAHGDKAYSYKDEWKEAGIPFARGVLLFLLTYTKLIGDYPKHKSVDWVIEQYPIYVDKIIEAEKEAGFA